MCVQLGHYFTFITCVHPIAIIFVVYAIDNVFVNGVFVETVIREGMLPGY
jgi:hypothetical protein